MPRTSPSSKSLLTSPTDSGAEVRDEADLRLSVGETEVIAIFVQMTQVLGVPRSLGEIYGLLFATPEPLAFQDIADRLQLSKGSVSQGLRFLRNVGAIKPVVIPGDRREFFEPVVELRALVSGFLRERLNPQLAEWGGRAKALKVSDFVRPEDAAAGSEGAKTLSSRLDKLKTWQKRANTVLPMIGKLLG